MSGSIRFSDDSTHDIDIVMTYEDGYWIRYRGTLDGKSATVKGDFFSHSSPSELKSLPGSDFVV